MQKYFINDLVQLEQIKEFLPHLLPQISCAKCRGLYNHNNFKLLRPQLDQIKDQSEYSDLMQFESETQDSHVINSGEEKHDDLIDLNS